jgi:hypothetical protein
MGTTTKTTGANTNTGTGGNGTGKQTTVRKRGTQGKAMAVVVVVHNSVKGAEDECSAGGRARRGGRAAMVVTSSDLIKLN